MTDAAFFILLENYLRSSNSVQNQQENTSVNFSLLSYYAINQIVKQGKTVTLY